MDTLDQIRDFARTAYDGMYYAAIVSTTKGNLVYMNPVASALLDYRIKDAEKLMVQQLFPFAPLSEIHTKTVGLERGNIPHSIKLHRSLLPFNGETYLLNLFHQTTSSNNDALELYRLAAPSSKHRDSIAELSVDVLLMNIMNNLSDLAYFKDASSRFILANQAMCNRVGLTLEQIVGKTDFDIFANEHAQNAYNDEQRILKTGERIIAQEEEEIWADGSTTWASTTKVPLTNRAGTTIGTFGVSRDITKRKLMEKELEKSQQKIVQAAQVKSDFLSNMSHKIRTPLNAIVGMGELLATTILSDEQQEFVNTISASSNALLEIVNNVLDISKIESGKLDIESVPFNLEEIIGSAINVIAPQARAKKIELMEHFKSNPPQTLLGDPTRIRQVLLNLLSNAVKFTTENGEILIEVSGQLCENKNYSLVLKVIDNGIGMSEAELSRIFNPFEQADTSTTRKYGGTGLGLSITNKLIGLMGGKLSVQSQKGHGSTFEIVIELKTESGLSSDTPLPEYPALKNRTILMVEDNPTNLDILKQLFKGIGATPIAFSSGQHLLTSLETLPPIHAVLLDYHMPTMNGYSLAEKLKGLPSFQHLPFVLLSSGEARELDTKKIINAWQTKPIKKHKLCQCLNQLLQTTTIKESVVDKKVENQLLAEEYPHRILLVEDNRVNQMVISKMLQKMGYKVDVEENGKRGLETALKLEHDLILMDIQMPIMDGLEATKEIRKQIDPDKQPIIAGISAHAMKESYDIAFESGMNHYLTKPLRSEKLIELLKTASH